MEGTSFEWKKDIAYFGRTISADGLKGRLSQFNNTLRNINGPGHGGAERFRYDFPDGEGLAKKLFVAVCPFKRNGRKVTPDNLLVYGQVLMAEYIAFAEHLKRFGALPKYNDTKASPKQKDLTLRSSGPARKAAQAA